MAQHIGIVACSAEGAALCYRTICVEGAALMGPHAHPEVSMHTPSLADYVVHLDAGNWQVSGTWEFQPGALLDWGGQNIFFYGDLDDIDVEDPTRDRWFNIDAGFERDPAKTPAAFQKRAFPFRIDGVRGMALTFANLSIQRSLSTGGGRTLQVRVDAQNLFNRQQWLGPTLNPTSTQFGRVTTVALNQMRFFSFGLRATF